MVTTCTCASFASSCLARCGGVASSLRGLLWLSAFCRFFYYFKNYRDKLEGKTTNCNYSYYRENQDLFFSRRSLHKSIPSIFTVAVCKTDRNCVGNSV